MQIAERRGDTLIVSAFMTLICLPLLAMAYGFGSQDLGENRALAEFPDLRRHAPDVIPSKIDAYWKDNMPFRASVINTFHAAQVRYASQIGRVIIGRAGWLFYTGEFHEVLRDLEGRDLLSDGELAQWREGIERRHEWCRQRGIRYLFVVVPNKETVYEELLPDWLSELPGPKLLDRLAAEFARSPVDFLDLRETLSAAKKDHWLYSAEDTHWTAFGRLAGYQRICQQLNLTSLQFGDDFRVESPLRGVGLRTQLDGRAVEAPFEELVFQRPPAARVIPYKMPERNWPKWADWQAPVATTNPAGKGRLLIFGDSFLRCAVTGSHEPLAEHFEHTLSLYLRPDSEAFRTLVESFRPDVVIEERVERYLKLVPEQDAGFDSDSAVLSDTGTLEPGSQKVDLLE